MHHYTAHAASPNPHGRARYQHRDSLAAHHASRAIRLALEANHVMSDWYPHRGTWRSHCDYCGCDLLVNQAGPSGDALTNDCPR